MADSEDPPVAFIVIVAVALLPFVPAIFFVALKAMFASLWWLMGW